MTKLWSTSERKINPIVEAYTAGTDHVFDMQLMPFDIEASRAHAMGLQKIGILTSKELEDILSALGDLEEAFTRGEIKITPEDEDCHTVIENYLVKKLGDTGKKIHTGRSRNDQILVATRLYMRSKGEELKEKCLGLASAFLGIAEKYKDVPMPGYSHTQQAMLSSVGHYMLAFTESLLDDADNLAFTLKHINKSPLGSAAGFGVSIPLDRKFTAKELRFDGVQVNSLYCQNSRGKFETMYMEALAQIMLTLGKFAGDMLLFTSHEFDFFSVDDSLVTGSSIMPQKKNLDVMEILRGNVSVVIANQLMMKDISRNLLSGYNRDLQLLKKPLIESVQIVLSSLDVVGLLLSGITPNEEIIREKITPGIFAADIANTLVQEEGMPFRDAYKKALGLVSKSQDLQKNITSKVSLGAPGNLDIAHYRRRIRDAS